MANSLAFWIDDLNHKASKQDNPLYRDDEVTRDTAAIENDSQIPETEKAHKPESKTKDDASVELHFNYWLLKAKSNKYFERSKDIKYLDVGVRLKGIISFQHINIYIPFPRESISYQSDLGEKISKDQDLVAAVFNTPVIETKSDPSHINYCDFTFFNGEKIRFYTNIAEQNSGISDGAEVVSVNEKGIILKFKDSIFNLEDGIDTYFRFRIEIKKSDATSISRVYNPRFPTLTNSFERSELVDFRVNEIRNLPKEIRNNITNKSYINKIHLFLIRDGKSEFKMAHDSYKRCRILESELWDKYLDLKKHFIDDEMLIYHWKDEIKKDANEISEIKYIDHFSAFAKYSKRDIKLIEILLFLLILVSLGAISGWCGNWVWAVAHPSFADTAPCVTQTKPSDAVSTSPPTYRDPREVQSGNSE